MSMEFKFWRQSTHLWESVFTVWAFLVLALVPHLCSWWLRQSVPPSCQQLWVLQPQFLEELRWSHMPCQKTKCWVSEVYWEDHYLDWSDSRWLAYWPHWRLVQTHCQHFCSQQTIISELDCFQPWLLMTLMLQLRCTRWKKLTIWEWQFNSCWISGTFWSESYPSSRETEQKTISWLNILIF